VVQGAVEIAERVVSAEHTVTEGQLAIFDAAAHYTLRALEDARVVLLGGERFATPRFIWWNFVASSQERIERAKQRWAEGRFPAVPGETEFIPLPKS
jgi:redox-sensitive bicupin YhaK (pirin superfamily)